MYNFDQYLNLLTTVALNPSWSCTSTKGSRHKKAVLVILFWPSSKGRSLGTWSRKRARQDGHRPYQKRNSSCRCSYIRFSDNAGVIIDSQTIPAHPHFWPDRPGNKDAGF